MAVQVGEVDAWATSLKQKVEAAVVAPADLQSLYRWSREYFVRQRRLHRFPGAYLVKAFNLAIKGLHYDMAMTGIVRESKMEARGSQSRQAGGSNAPRTRGDGLEPRALSR